MYKFWGGGRESLVVEHAGSEPHVRKRDAPPRAASGDQQGGSDTTRCYRYEVWGGRWVRGAGE